VKLAASHRGGDQPFEGDRTVTLVALPKDAVVSRAQVAVTPATPWDSGIGMFEEVIDFRSGGDPLGATKEGPSGPVADLFVLEVDFHTRRTLVSVDVATGTNLPGCELQVDMGGGVFIELNDRGAIRVPDDNAFLLPANGTLPGITMTRFRLLGQKAPDIGTLTVRSVPTNLSLRLGQTPAFWTHLGELTAAETTPDFSGVLRAFLPRADVGNGVFVVPIVVHSDTLARLDVQVEVEYAWRRPLLPPDLREVTVPFDFGTLPGSSQDALRAELPPGARPLPSGVAGQVRGKFDPTRVAAGPIGSVRTSGSVPVVAGRSQAQPLVLDDDERCTAVDLLLSAVSHSARIAMDVHSDADGKPWSDSLLARPVTVDLDRSEAGAPTWISMPLPTEFLFRAGQRYWVVLEALSGEAQWSMRASPDGHRQPPLQASVDGGLSWRASTTAGPVEGLFRLRRTPSSFEMPVLLEVGQLEATGPAGSSPGVVAFDRFQALGRVDLSLGAIPEVTDAVDRYVRATDPAECAEVEHLANGDFLDTANDPVTGVVTVEDWELTAGEIEIGASGGVFIGSNDGPTGLSQIVPVRAGCRYRLDVTGRGSRDDVVAEALWRGSDCAAVRTDQVSLVDEREKRLPFHRAYLEAPAAATQAEVRFTVPTGESADVRHASFASVRGALFNGDLRQQDEDGIPSGWNLEPAEAKPDVRLLPIEVEPFSGVVFQNGSRSAVTLAQRFPVDARGSSTLSFRGLALAVPGRTTRVELQWSRTNGSPVVDPVVLVIDPEGFDRYLALGDPAPSSAGAELRIVVPSEGTILVQELELDVNEPVEVPLTFLAHAPGQLTVSDASITYDIPAPLPPPVPASGLCNATPPGAIPRARPEDRCYCPWCKQDRTVAGPTVRVSRGGRPVLSGACLECGTGLVRLGGPADVSVRMVAGPPRPSPEKPPLPPAEWPTTEVRGIGPARAAFLTGLGIATMGDLATASPELVGRSLRGLRPGQAKGFVDEARLLSSAPVEVTAVVRGTGAAPHQRVAAIGGRNPDGTPWRLSQREAVAGLDRERWAFQVRPAGLDQVPVMVREGPLGHRYLTARTRPGGSDVLSALPEPSDSRSQPKGRPTS